MHLNLAKMRVLFVNIKNKFKHKFLISIGKILLNYSLSQEKA